jgi:hypothetical protein
VGPRYIVWPSRGRPHRPTSAVDVATRIGDGVLSPVTGTVWRVKRYRLYGAYFDLRISVIPSGHPELRVIIIHVAHVRVRRGSILVAGVTPIARVRVLPFRSQVNDYVGGGVPHIHIEVKSVGAPRH